MAHLSRRSFLATGALAVTGAADDPLRGPFRWRLGPPLVAPVERPADPCHSVKDPTVVFFEGRWHLFCTIRSVKRTHQIEYLTFADWNQANAAPRHVLDASPARVSLSRRPSSERPSALDSRESSPSADAPPPSTSGPAWPPTVTPDPPPVESACGPLVPDPAASESGPVSPSLRP